MDGADRMALVERLVLADQLHGHVRYVAREACRHAQGALARVADEVVGANSHRYRPAAEERFAQALGDGLGEQPDERLDVGLANQVARRGDDMATLFWTGLREDQARLPEPCRRHVAERRVRPVVVVPVHPVEEPRPQPGPPTGTPARAPARA